MKIYKLYFLPS